MVENVVLLTIDSLRHDAVGFLNSECRDTPYMDRLASRGTVLKNAFAAGGGTMFAMSGLMTSAYPVINVEDKGISGWPTLASRFRREGYRTVAFHSNPWLSAAFGFDTDYHEFNYVAPELPAEDTVDRGSLFGRIPVALDEFLNITIRNSPPYITADSLFDQARTWIRLKDGASNFFMWIHLMDVHYPYAAPMDLLQRINPGRILRYGANFILQNQSEIVPSSVAKSFALLEEYGRSISHVDAKISEFMDCLPEDTVLVILSDHGELFGEHGHFGHQGHLFNEIVKVPVLIAGSNSGAETFEENVSTTKLGQVIADLARGKEVKSIVEGRAFSIHIDYTHRMRRTSLVDGDWKLHVTEDFRTGQRSQALYNISKDPKEECDTADKEKELVRDLARKQVEIMRASLLQRYRLSLNNISFPNAATRRVSS